MFDDSEKSRKAAKWVIGVVSACILVYLGIRHIGTVAEAVGWLVNLLKPLLLGAVLALVLNVPMSMIEGRLLKKLRRGKRPLAILLALFLVVGIFVGVAFLVVPELIDAITLIIQIVREGLEQLDGLDNTGALAQTPLAEWINNIDWMRLSMQLETWLKEQSGDLAGHAMGAVGSVVNGVVTFVIGLVFAIYILSGKERFKFQASRLLRV